MRYRIWITMGLLFPFTGASKLMAEKDREANAPSSEVNAIQEEGNPSPSTVKNRLSLSFARKKALSLLGIGLLACSGYGLFIRGIEKGDETSYEKVPKKELWQAIKAQASEKEVQELLDSKVGVGKEVLPIAIEKGYSMDLILQLYNRYESPAKMESPNTASAFNTSLLNQLIEKEYDVVSTRQFMEGVYPDGVWPYDPEWKMPNPLRVAIVHFCMNLKKYTFFDSSLIREYCSKEGKGYKVPEMPKGWQGVCKKESELVALLVKWGVGKQEEVLYSHNLCKDECLLQCAVEQGKSLRTIAQRSINAHNQAYKERVEKMTDREVEEIVKYEGKIKKVGGESAQKPECLDNLDLLIEEASYYFIIDHYLAEEGAQDPGLLTDFEWGPPDPA